MQTLELTAAQIRRLEILRQDVISRQKNIEDLEREILQNFIVQEQPIYNRFWQALESGKDIETLTEEIAQLQEIRDQNQKNTQKDLLSLRLQSIREFLRKHLLLRTMTSKQEQKYRSLFFYATNSIL